ncbi:MULTISPECIES: hypothetical protein [unclassified Nocardia]|uniref:hypothetical protein n=1 Tax=unclassified Nocardia TaxID=2637762 RepID=UPI0024A7CD9D|nr:MULTISPECIES: hypothetical protein [unclassified Nocardia]
MFDIVGAWLGGARRVLWARTDAGEPMAIWGRIVGSDFHICGANRLIGDQVVEFEKWEATRYD